MPRRQHTSDHTQKHSIIVSHMILVLDTRNTGVSTPARVARSGRSHNPSARRYMPQAAPAAGSKNAACKAISLQPKRPPTSAST